MAGDFNYDIKRFGHNMFVIEYNGIKRKLFFNKTHLKTCCKEIDKKETFDKHIDHILDSKSEPTLVKTSTIEAPASDHVPVYGELIN